MSNYNEYTKGGGLNPFFVEDECHQRELDQFVADSKYLADKLGNDSHSEDTRELFEEMYDFIEESIKKDYEIHEDTYYVNLQRKCKYKELGRLEGQMAFLDQYNGDKEKLRLAKLLLSIKG